MRKYPKYKKGFTFVELIVGVSVFLVIVVAVYNAYISIFDVVETSKSRITATDLINEQFEMIRNLPYSDVGVMGSIPSGVLTYNQTLKRNDFEFSVLTTVRNVDDPFDGVFGGSPNDLSPADYKLVEIEVNCQLCKNFKPMVVSGRIAPKNLETASTNGALFVRVFDAFGNPVQGATVRIENNQSNPPIVIEDITNNQGMLQIVDVPPGVEAYEISVTKVGYSTDRTYSRSVSNPNPVKTHATVVIQQVTQISFAIDILSELNIYSITDTCEAVPSVGYSLTGSKLIGNNPNILKYSTNGNTGSGGVRILNNIEWDTYNIESSGQNYDVIGYNPISPLLIEPGSLNNLRMIVAPKDPNTILIIVKDSVTGLPLSDVYVNLSRGSFDETRVTGQGFKVQTDWSGGSGQSTSTDLTRYLYSDGNIETSLPVGDLLLKRIFGEYVSSGEITSSSFDMGGSANFFSINWTPIGQPNNSSVRVQVATNNDGGTWNFVGPDGTSGSYYTSSDKNMHSSHSGSRYLRYKIYLDSSATTTSPNISDFAFTFTSSCTPPGQVHYSGLSSGLYDLSVYKSGYEQQQMQININSEWQSQVITLIPN